MFQDLQQFSRWLSYLIGSAIAILLPLTASAQLAPVMGTRYAVRVSDIGFAGAVNSQGGYGATVPLELFPATGGLPAPLSVVYGGRQFGAAGLGWDAPLSYIYHSKTIAHRRPKPGAFSTACAVCNYLRPELYIGIDFSSDSGATRRQTTKRSSEATLFYSCRRACSGSTFVVRPAGMKLAIMATPTSSKAINAIQNH